MIPAIAGAVAYGIAVLATWALRLPVDPIKDAQTIDCYGLTASQRRNGYTARLTDRTGADGQPVVEWIFQERVVAVQGLEAGCSVEDGKVKGSPSTVRYTGRDA